jgi:predicted glycoside hydrolase/deacetylase ChbG (UPF0249 family)
VRIVVNADDFGLSQDTVRATIECFEQGVLTSASIMATMEATDEAIGFARAHPEFSFGVHLTFVGDGSERACSDPADVRHLVDAEGRLAPTNRVRLRAALRRIPVSEIAQETAAQVSAVQDAGVRVSHVDSHRHLHKYALFREGLERALPQLGVSRVRNVQDVYVRRPLLSPTRLFGGSWRRRLMQSFTTTDHFYMPASTGDASWESVWSRLESLPPDATVEVGVHPGYDGWRNDERVAVAAFAGEARRRGHDLVPWHAIGDQAESR